MARCLGPLPTPTLSRPTRLLARRQTRVMGEAETQMAAAGIAATLAGATAMVAVVTGGTGRRGL